MRASTEICGQYRSTYSTQVVIAALGFAIYGVGCEICGITLEKFNDIKEGDIFEAFIMEEYRPD